MVRILIKKSANATEKEQSANKKIRNKSLTRGPGQARRLTANT